MDEKANSKNIKKLESTNKPYKKKSGILNLFDLKAISKNPKVVKVIVIIGFAIIMFIFLSDIFSGLSPENKGEEYSSGNITSGTVEIYEKQLEEKLRDAVSKIEGVGEITIMLTLDSLSETVYSDRGTGVKTVITPKVRGVAIICDGGGDIVVKQKVVELVSRVLGIGATKVSVTN